MNSEFKKILENEKKQQIIESNNAGQNEHATKENGRRSFLKKATLGGLALGGMMGASIEDTLAYTTQNVKRASSPSEMKITDCSGIFFPKMRVLKNQNGKYNNDFMRE